MSSADIITKLIALRTPTI